MKFKLFNAGLFLLLCVGASAQQPSSKASYVDPFIGTDGMGHTFPGACVPFGGVQLSPDTDTIPHNVNGKYQPRAYEYCAQVGDQMVRSAFQRQKHVVRIGKHVVLPQLVDIILVLMPDGVDWEFSRVITLTVEGVFYFSAIFPPLVAGAVGNVSSCKEVP